MRRRAYVFEVEFSRAIFHLPHFFRHLVSEGRVALRLGPFEALDLPRSLATLVLQISNRRPVTLFCFVCEDAHLSSSRFLPLFPLQNYLPSSKDSLPSKSE
mgnify:CR=1 FL=1